jgi:dual specificity protein kinase YAK1
MNKEKIVFSFTPGGCFVTPKTSNSISPQTQPTFDFSKHPKEKPPNRASLILYGVTTGILDTFKKCNPDFNYTPQSNPKRCLTNPPEGVLNNGYDNENNEYILYVSDIIKSPENEEYVIMELLGKGTFGQVIRCVRKSKEDVFAIKIIKNKPAYTNQALSEVKIFKKIKEEHPVNEKYIVRLFDYFVFRNHICLVFEMLHVSLYDLLRLSNFSGFSLRFIARLSEQIVESIICLEKNKIIHCDLKPENILFADEESDKLKLIDLGSACFTHSTPYTYIQSRFYRAPEVILGAKYNNKIDSWSFGCMVAEFYLGLPIFPGSSEYDQMRRIVEILGVPEYEVVDNGRFKNKLFKKENDAYVFKTPEEFELENQTQLPPHKKYFILKRLEDLEMYYNKSKQREKQPSEKPRFEIFLHFLKGLLHLNPKKRWTAAQAKLHPFLTNSPFEPDWEPMDNPSALNHWEDERSKQTLENTHPHKEYDNFDPFNRMSTQGFDAESYRPYIPPDVKDRNEEVKSQFQNVYLLNSQNTSTKPKKKLNLKAANFNTDSFQLPNMDSYTKKQGSHSEPNSATNSSKKRVPSKYGETAYTYEEEGEEYIEEQDGNPQPQLNNLNVQPPNTTNFNMDQQQMNPQFNPQYNQQMMGPPINMQFNPQQMNPQINPQMNPQINPQQFNPQINPQQMNAQLNPPFNPQFGPPYQWQQPMNPPQMNPPPMNQQFGYRDNNNMSQNPQFYNQNQYGGGYGGYYQGENTGGYRQRSNSDQGASENIYFQQNRQGKQNRNKGFNKNQNNNQGQGQGQGGYQPQNEQVEGNNPGGQKHQNKWSNNSGYKNKYGNKNYYSNQRDEKEERKEK